MNPEKSAMNNLDARRRHDDIADTAEMLLPSHDKIASMMEKISIKTEDFIDLYSEEGIARDNRYVAGRHEDFAKQSKDTMPNGLTFGEVRNLAEILEYQIIKGINGHNWIPLCQAIKTSEYDDIANGVDLVLEFQDKHHVNHLGMGIDISFSRNLTKKFERIKNEIDSYDGKENRMGVVKYFNSQKTGMRGELSGLPRVVAALDLGVMEDMAKAPKSMEGHIAKHAIITEMEHQLNVFAKYAERKNPACAERIYTAQNFIKVISTHFDSEEKLARSEYQKNNKIQDAILEGLEMFR